MADPRDDRVSSAYRELPGAGPTPALDAAIQAAARRAVGSRPGGARRWQIPVSIAAVLALAIGVSLQVDREKPLQVDGTPVSSGSAEYPVVQAAPEKEERAAPASPPAAVPTPPTPAAQDMLAKEAAPVIEVKRFAPDPPRAEVPPPAPAPAATLGRIASPPAAAGAAATADSMRAAPQGARRAKSEASRDANLQEKSLADAPDTPERRLERIAELRSRGLHDEADRALTEFRRAHPGYRISDEWLRKVER